MTFRDQWAQMRERGSTGQVPIFAGANVFWIFAFTSHPTVNRIVLALIAITSSVLFTGIPFVAAESSRVKRRWFLALCLPLALLAVLDPIAALFFGTFVAMGAATLLPMRAAIAVAVTTSALMFGGAWHIHDGVLFSLACMSLFMSATAAFSIERSIARSRLATAEQRNAVLAVAAERERIGRDLHDILGHSLTAIAVKGDLARRLVTRDPDAAAAQLDELVTIARQALSETRATASGLRETRAASELASARSVLESAGITCRTPSAIPHLDDAVSELFGFVIREGVTNVVRHAGATTCQIEVTSDGVEVRDDGTRGPRVSRDGRPHGLSGLQGRAAALGYDVRLTREASHTVLRCQRVEVSASSNPIPTPGGSR